VPSPPRRLDVLGHFCPLPVLFAAREMLRLRPGDRLELLGDDPAMQEDVPAWCDHAGHRLLETAEEEGRLRFLIEKGPPGER
jgi:tRNA 2-thiouridine synthesizing protein A